MRILLAAEFTRDERVPVLADALTEAGHSVTLAVRDPLAWQPRASVQAPAWRAEPPPGFLASTYADILLHGGYATLEALHGLLTGWLAFRAGGGLTQHTRLFFATGVLGGYTTFSTFSLETILLFESGKTAAALAYVVGSVLLGALSLWAGLALMRSLT